MSLQGLMPSCCSTEPDGNHRQARPARKHHPDLPAFARPGAQPVENVWQYLRQNWLSNTVFENYDAIIDAACAA
jgi:hypothetical protein